MSERVWTRREMDKELRRDLRYSLRHKAPYYANSYLATAKDLTREQMKRVLDDILHEYGAFHTSDRGHFNFIFKDVFKREIAFALGRTESNPLQRKKLPKGVEYV